ncbi:MAG: hypothetical protein ACE5D0_03050 [Fidelibacterota bacterium]
MKIINTSISIFIISLIIGCSELDKSFKEPLPDRVTYKSHIKAILDRSCVRCHGGSEQIVPDVNFSSYSEIKLLIGTDVSSDLIVPGNQSSGLLRKTKPGGSMNLNLNDNRDYDLLYQWIVLDSVAQN